MLLCEGVEHPEAIVEAGSDVAIDLPGEAEWHSQDVMHVVCGSPMSKVSCRSACEQQKPQMSPVISVRSGP